MTVEEKIRQLNSEFQKLYWDDRHDFFSYLIPEKLGIIREFITSVVQVGNELYNNIETDSLLILDNQISDSISGNKDHLDRFKENLKDSYLHNIKKNTSELLWRFRYALWNFKESMLHQVI